MARLDVDAGIADDADVPEAGYVIDGKYRVEKVLGEGGMGVVLAAHHELLDQRVAVKVLTARDKTALSRFSLEAKSTARLRSEHVARVMDVGALPNGAPFIVLEYLEGCDLAELLELNGRLQMQDAVDYALQALEGLAQAHALGIIHRDLKPANLFLAVQPSGASLIKILDFGISKSIASRRSGRTGSVTGDFATLGSPRYMSPEQIRSTKNVDARSDIWSIGVVLFELLSGEQPFRGESYGETFAAILESDPPGLLELRPDLPPELVNAVARCMKRDREKRFPDVYEVARAIGRFGTAESAARVRRIEQTLRNAKAVSDGDHPAPKASTGAIRAAARLSSNLDPTAVLTESGSHDIQFMADSERAQIVTGHVAFTSDAPKAESLATTAVSIARRRKRRAVMVAVGAFTLVGAAAAAIVVVGVSRAHARVEDVTLRVDAPITAIPPSPEPTPPEPTPVTTSAHDEPQAEAVPIETIPVRHAPPPARSPAHAKPIARPAPAPAHHAPAPPKKRPSVLDSPD